MNKVRKYIAVAINHISCAYNPNVIIVNGSLIRKCPDLFAKALIDLDKYMFKPIQYSVNIEYSKLGANASLFGIGEIACDKVFDLLVFKNKNTID